jgi:fructose-bisphosphate aldolase class I
MRSVIAQDSRSGIAAIVTQQFEVAQRIASHGLMPIIEPEVSIKSPTKAAAEAILKEELTHHLDAMKDGRVMLKLTLPEEADLYETLTRHPRVERVVALSGGYNLDEACERLRQNHGMIASFSRALIDDLRQGMTDTEFDAALAETINKIYQASTSKRVLS